MTGADDVIHLVVAFVEDAGGVEPPHDVPASVYPGHTDVPTDGQDDGTTGSVYLFGQLDTGRRGSNDHDTAYLKLVGVAIVGCSQAANGRRDDLGECRHVGAVVWAAGDNNRIGPPLGGGGEDPEAV